MHSNRFSYPGSFAQTQQAMAEGWMASLQQQKRPRVLSPEYLERARRKHFCVACLQGRGALVKMDYFPVKEKWSYSTYEVDAHRCPACGKQERFWEKVQGRGHSGKDSF